MNINRNASIETALTSKALKPVNPNIKKLKLLMTKQTNQ